MHDKDLAEITAQIVAAVIQSGKMLTLDVREVSTYYSAMYEHIRNLDNPPSSTQKLASH